MPGFKDRWKARREAQAATVATGRVVVRSQGGRMHVATPPNALWDQKARALAGRWREKSGVWSFGANQRPLVLGILRNIFGKRGIP